MGNDSIGNVTWKPIDREICCKLYRKMLFYAISRFIKRPSSGSLFALFSPTVTVLGNNSQKMKRKAMFERPFKCNAPCRYAISVKCRL